MSDAHLPKTMRRLRMGPALRMALTLAAAVLAAALLVAPARAGQTCDARAPSADTVVRGLALAQRTAAWLDASGAEVAVIARAGQDLQRYGLTYSHLGFVLRDPARGDRPAAWRVVHKLNHCGSDRAAVYRQGLAEFFLDGLHDEQAGIVIPTHDVQTRLAPLLRDNARVAALHTPAYNMVAYPWSQRYQQSNQWALETLALAMSPDVHDRRQAQAWLQLKGYRPTTLRLGPLTRLGARATTAHIAFDDHPAERRFTDRIDTVTVDSVFEWLPRSGLGQPVRVVR